MNENNSTTATEPSSPNDNPTKMPKLWAPRAMFPTVADLLVLVGLFVVANLIASVVAMVAGMQVADMKLLFSDDEAVRTAAQYAVAPFNAITYFISMVITIVGFIYYRHRRGGVNSIGSFSLRGFNPLVLLWGAVLILSTSVVLEPLLSLLPAPPDVYGRGMWAVVMMVVMAPLFEEILFRGIIIDSARAKWGTMGALLLSSAVFGLVHFYPAVVVNAAVMGVVFGFLYIKTGSLWAPILLHALNNGIAYLMIVTYGTQKSTLIDIVGNRTLYGLIYIVALAVFAISVYMILRTLKSLKEEQKNGETE